MNIAETVLEFWWFGGHIDVVDIFCVGAVQLPGTGHITDIHCYLYSNVVPGNFSQKNARIDKMVALDAEWKDKDNVQHICIPQ